MKSIGANDILKAGTKVKIHKYLGECVKLVLKGEGITANIHEFKLTHMLRKNGNSYTVVRLSTPKVMSPNYSCVRLEE